eukprot:5830049-Pyramimonas_sp.AAC.1
MRQLADGEACVLSETETREAALGIVQQDSHGDRKTGKVTAVILARFQTRAPASQTCSRILGH